VNQSSKRGKPRSRAGAGEFVKRQKKIKPKMVARARRPAESGLAAAFREHDEDLLKESEKKIMLGWLRGERTSPGSERSFFADYRKHRLAVIAEEGGIVANELAPRELQRMQKSGTPQSRCDDRRSVMVPILDREGFSIHDWAINSGVDFHTADNYLKGKTNPRPSTRKKLAESLKLSIESLPS
jgi:hypothetical protein